jgi:hypothetical protein
MYKIDEHVAQEKSFSQKQSGFSHTIKTTLDLFTTRSIIVDGLTECWEIAWVQSPVVFSPYVETFS